MRQRKLTAMRDQTFQQLMSDFNWAPIQSDGPAGRSEENTVTPVGEAKPNIVENLDSQLEFKQFLKRNLPNRKPSSEFIKSIQNRIKLMDNTTTDSEVE